MAYQLATVTLMVVGVLFSACGGNGEDQTTNQAGKGGMSGGGDAGSSPAPAGTSGTSEGGNSSSAGAGHAGSLQAGAAGNGQGGSSGGKSGGSAGAAGGNEGGHAGMAQAGSGGTNQGAVEYLACLQQTAIDRIGVYRVDETGGTCTRVVVAQAVNCPSGVANGGWCLEQALLSADVPACKDLMTPADAKAASSASGTIAVSSATVELDLMLQFPDGGNLPTSMAVQVNDCAADCMANDCRQ